MKEIFRKKNVGFVRDVAEHSKLVKTLGLMDLIFIGIGAVIGTGIFVLTGVNAAIGAGPAIVLSFVLAGVTCIFVALAYTEIASTLPSSGGAYTFAYVSLGEVFASMVGWLSVLQLSCGSMTVASGWSGYVVGALKAMGVELPASLIASPAEGGLINLPATLICIVISLILIRGVQESTKFNNLFVIIKLAAIGTFIAIASPKVNFDNWSNFMPFGYSGVASVAGSIFMAYTGFDAIANAAEEAKKPERDITISLIATLLICMGLYVTVSALVTLIAPYTELNNAEPLAYALKTNGSSMGGMIVAVGGIAGMTTVILVNIYAQTRIFMAMSRDGLMPKLFSKIHPKFATPYKSTLLVGTIMGLFAGLVPIKQLGDLASLGTLVMFIFVTISCIALRIRKPDIHRPFKCPALYLISTIAILACLYLIYNILAASGFGLVTKSFIGWALAGLAFYFLYSKQNADRIYKENH